MITWHCDVCGNRIGDSTERGPTRGESVTQVTAYTESINKQLDGCGHLEHIFDPIYVCEACKKRMKSALHTAFQTLQKANMPPPCPIYLPTEDDRMYERLVCGAIVHYRFCAGYGELVEWLETFHTNLMKNQVTAKQCNALSLMYHCGEFVLASQATNLIKRLA